MNNSVDPSPINYRSSISSWPPQTVAASSTSPSTPNSHSSTHEIEILKSKIRQLENQLAKSTKSDTETCAPTPVSDIETTHSHLAGTFHIHNASLPSNQGQMVRRSFIHKKRFFGQSHWISSMSLVRILSTYIALELTYAKKPSVSRYCRNNRAISHGRRVKGYPGPSKVQTSRENDQGTTDTSMAGTDDHRFALEGYL